MQTGDDLKRLIVERLQRDKESLRQAFNAQTGTRTRHFVCDDLLPTEIAERICEAFPEDQSHFTLRETFREKKRTSAKFDVLDPILKDITYAIQSPEVIAIVGEITGMDMLEPDPTLYAGGLSMMAQGDFLNPHIDNSHDAKRNRYRRLNLLYYVSRDWKVENGGNLELWDDRVTKPVTIASNFNRLAVMETNKYSWHSVSPVRVGQLRRCVSNYYFSKVSPDGSDYFHVTAFNARPEQRLLRVYSRVDGVLRNFVGGVLGVGRGKEQAYQGDKK